MRILLDTHSFLWFIAGSDSLSTQARDLIADLGNEVLLSTGSLWELAIKVSIGKIELSRPFGEIIPEQLSENEITVLPIELSHLTMLTELPFHHRDPFDRLIIAQGIVEGLPVITRDIMFRNYPVDILW
ncbi:MAG: PIN domain nuclease [Candidatus Latescibacterota bacterium]|nr:MAG: twitching motility protein PilT [Candidatus Latescibacteria bacterium 4484_107]RKY72815.1 MAG: PIN domain nuclease [Candidatus Latescibacterota bacterium]